MRDGGFFMRSMMPRRALLAGGTACMALGGAWAESPASWGLWAEYKRRFMRADGRIIDAHDHVASHSEGQGYGMLFAEHYDDPDAFDKIWNWTRTTLRRPADVLFAWRYLQGATPPIPDPNNATDGDLLIALALARAAHRWRNATFMTEAKRIYAALREKIVVTLNGQSLLLPGVAGFFSPGEAVLNLSYYIIPSLQMAGQLDDSETWSGVLHDGLTIMRQARFGQWALPPDWTVLGEGSGRPAIASGHPPRFSYDAIRIPLYLQWGRMLEGALAKPFAEYWRAWPEGKMPAWVDLQTGVTASFPAPAGFHAIGVACGFTETMPERLEPSEDYYSASLVLLAHVVTSDLAARLE